MRLDALGHSAYYEYDLLGNLTALRLYRVDTQDKVNEWEVTLYEYDSRGLTTKVIDAMGNVTTNEYDGNGNLVKTTDADGYVTVRTYNALDLVTSINYNGGKEVTYQYNAVGELIKMTDWTGVNTFEVDLLNRITKVTDHKGKVVQYTYDEVGNQTSIAYPDNTTVNYTYDLVGNMETVTETDGRTTTYTYDGMGRVTKMEYPHGWKEDYHYDSIGQLTAVEDTDPTNKNMKQQKHTYEYDACGNITHEYMRGNGTGQATTEVFYTYDALHRIVKAKENYGNATRNYTYDSLGNLTYEQNSNNVTVDYKLNKLNQITEKSEDGWKNKTVYTYDKRGNLINEVYVKNNNKNPVTTATYTYDATNRMVSGTNDTGEQSNYTFNGLDVLVEQTWVIGKNNYGYTSNSTGEVQSNAVVNVIDGFDSASDLEAANAQPEGVPTGRVTIYIDGDTGDLMGAEGVTYQTLGSSQTSVITKSFVIDYTSETQNPLMEYESTGLTYRYVYGNQRLSVDINGVTNGAGSIIESNGHIRLYYHQDYLGTTDYLTSPVSKKVLSWTHYNEWGEITHNAILKCGQRELDLVKNYTGYEYDAVLDLYYAKYRMYDAGDRRFTAIDPIRDGLNWYVYVGNNPINWVDPLGLEIQLKGNAEDRKELLERLQMLTDDILEEKVRYLTLPYGGKIPIYYVSTVNASDSINYPVGTDLVREIINSSKTVEVHFDTSIYNINKTEFYIASASNGIGGNAKITVAKDPNSKNYTIDKDGEVVNSKVEDYIILGHELVHAYHVMTGTTLPEDDLSMSIYMTSKNGEAKLYYWRTEELKTVGLQYYPLLVCPEDLGTEGGILWWYHNDISRDEYGNMVDSTQDKYTENALRAEHGLPLRIEYIAEDIGSIKWEDAIKMFPDYQLPSYPSPSKSGGGSTSDFHFIK